MENFLLLFFFYLLYFTVFILLHLVFTFAFTFLFYVFYISFYTLHTLFCNLFIYFLNLIFYSFLWTFPLNPVDNGPEDQLCSIYTVWYKGPYVYPFITFFICEKYAIYTDWGGLFLSCAFSLLLNLSIFCPLPSFPFTHGAAVCRGEKCMCLVFWWTADSLYTSV